jgi:murein DD-endopeptidase MepM/ murein hydrolase activator NlpD
VPIIDLSTIAVVDFPLRGEWRALNTPAERVPSHGTDYFGQRYALDFVRIDETGTRFHRESLARHLFAVVPAEGFLCWNEPVCSAFPGQVVACGDGWPDRLWVNAFWELVRGTFLATGPRGTDYRPLAGNFVIVQGEIGVAMYGHLRNGSVRVAPGEAIAAGAPLGAVGNSGNSTMPHLHFQLMEGTDPLTARGLPCAFRCYERFVGGAWEPVQRGVPEAMERVRSSAPSRAIADRLGAP